MQNSKQLQDQQNDEFRSLKDCFTDQLVDLRKLIKVSRNPKKRKRDKLWIPLELTVKIESRPEALAAFDLHVKCSRQYPLVPPAIGFKNVKGIGRALIAKLHRQLKFEASNEEHRGHGCIARLIMRSKQFLEDHYHELELNNKSFYDQMVEQKQNCDKRVEMSRKHCDQIEKLERDRQVEEIRQKILRKRELLNESKKRRDSQNSNSLEGIDTEDQTAPYDYYGDLDGIDSATTSVTDDGETQRRLNEIEEFAEDDKTLVTRSRRATLSGQCHESRSSAEEQGYPRSRVDDEYAVIKELGHGGFGTVYMVRNRVDSQLYALKKVELDPDNDSLNEKIRREVRLLSKLNHENVIRYYTAWSEIVTRECEPNAGSRSDKCSIDESTLSPKINQESYILSQTNSSDSDSDDDVYHTSYLINDKNIDRDTTTNYVDFETSDNKDENEIVESMKKALRPRLSDGEESSDEESANDSRRFQPRIKTQRWLYIQMELGQGTLREAIDQGLPKQKDRARRFFREILDGLCHIHRQGIIHRDLKPVNIFLDSLDRPKIGDFGLATTNLFIVTQSQSASGVTTATAIKPNRMSLEKLPQLASPDQISDSPGGDSIASGVLNKSRERLKYIHTGNIGTPLYMSPELSATREQTRIAKVIYSDKVDVYSLGIIYFEMLYSFDTGHERIDILQDLRKKEIKMPIDVDERLSREDIELIRLLLTHDVAARPTSDKLSTSNLLPSIDSKEREYQNIIKQVVQNRQARTHKHMLKLLFEQNDSYVDDFVFDYEDVDCPLGSGVSARPESQSLLKDFNANTYALDQVKMKLEIMLRSKGFTSFVAPILMPKYSAVEYYSKQQIEDVVMLIDKNSSILTLPYDLRLPFARFVSRANINYMNRFAIERIFRQRRVLGYHPDQFWECCVDIITPPPGSGARSQIADAEIINLIGEVVKSFPLLTNLRPVLKINHIQLVKAIMGMLGVKEAQMNDIITCIAESMSVSLKRQAQFASPAQTQFHNQLSSNFQGSTSLPVHARENLKKDLLASKLVTNINMINTLINFLDIAGDTPTDVYTQLEQAFNSRNLRTIEYLKDARKTLRDLDETICYAQGLGLDIAMRISPGFVFGALPSMDNYNAMIFMLECKRSNKSRNRAQPIKTIVLAVGGRYDQLMDKFSRNKSEVFDQLHNGESGERAARENSPKSATGVSFEVERLAKFVLEDYIDKVNNQDNNATPQFHQLVQSNTHQASMPNSLTSLFTNVPIRYWTHDIAVCSLSTSKSRAIISVMAGFVKQLREKGLKCYEIMPLGTSSFSVDSLTLHCIENRIPYMLTVKFQSSKLVHDDFLQGASVGSDTSADSSPSKDAPSTPVSPRALSSSGCIAILYQLDRVTLKEMKRCDIQGMLDHLFKH